MKATPNSVILGFPTCYPYRQQLEDESDYDLVSRKAKELDDEFLRLGLKTVAAFIAESIVGTPPHPWRCSLCPRLPNGYAGRLPQIRYSLYTWQSHVWNGSNWHFACMASKQCCTWHPNQRQRTWRRVSTHRCLDDLWRGSQCAEARKWRIHPWWQRAKREAQSGPTRLCLYRQLLCRFSESSGKKICWTMSLGRSLSIATSSRSYWQSSKGWRHLRKRSFLGSGVREG